MCPSKALSLAPEGVVKQPMEMGGRGAEHAGGSSAGSSASSEVSGEPAHAGEDEEASVVAESPHPDDEGVRARKRKRAPAAAAPWPPPPQPPQRPDSYVHTGAGAGGATAARGAEPAPTTVIHYHMEVGKFLSYANQQILSKGVFHDNMPTDAFWSSLRRDS